jgi:hypothetical protein
MSRFLLSALVLLFLSPTTRLKGETVAVRYPEGTVRGFLVLTALDGNHLADGDLFQNVSGDKVTCRVVFRFRDGSVHDETAVFSQRDRFELVTDHLVQKGPSFPHPVETSMDLRSGSVSVRYREDDGKEKTYDEHLTLPADVANGLIFTLLKNLRRGDAPTTVSMLAATPKPRVVKLVMAAAGEDAFSVGRASHTSTRYDVKLEGLIGFVASLVGKKPAPTSVWILDGDAPTFVKAEGPLYVGGPIWRIELTSPVWPQAVAQKR